MIENSTPEKNTYFLNVFHPKDALEGRTSDISVKRIKGKNCIGVEITAGETTETFLSSTSNQIDYKNIKSQTKWISLVKDKSGKTVKTAQYNPASST